MTFKNGSRQKEKHFNSKEKIIGQFLTPKEASEFIVSFITTVIGLREKKLGIDPACGDGIFLKAFEKARFKRIIGIDIDKEIIKDISSDIKTAEIFEGDGLDLLRKDIEGHADIVGGNPPFSAKYGRVTDRQILSEFELGKDRKSQAIEILFLERFIQLASVGGGIGIILPAGIFSNIPLQYVRDFIFDKTRVLGVISLPRNIFNGGKKTTSKTCILFAKKLNIQERDMSNKNKIFMGIAKNLKDLPLFINSYHNKDSFLDSYQNKASSNPIVFWVNGKPDFLYPELNAPSDIIFGKSVKTEELEQFISKMFCGRTEYGSKRKFAEKGIPFISAKTVTNLGIDFSRDEKYVEPDSQMDKKTAHVQIGDVLFVRVGVGCIGRVAIVTDESECGIADDWIYIIRAKEGISPYFLAFYLQSRYGQSQISQMKHGVGTVTIPQAFLKKIPVPTPTQALQQRLKAIYLEMVKLRKNGRISEAAKKFNDGIKEINNFMGEE